MPPELERLPESEFVRVHRSAIVRVDRITKVTRFNGRDALLELDGGHEVKMSRTGPRGPDGPPS